MTGDLAKHKIYYVVQKIKVNLLIFSIYEECKNSNKCCYWKILEVWL